MDKPLRTATSPDGELTLELYEADEFYLGFKDYAWHTHGDLLVPEYGPTPKSGALAFFESIVSDHEPICVSRRPGREANVYVTDDAAWELGNAEADEDLIVRYWSGEKCTGAEA